MGVLYHRIVHGEDNTEHTQKMDGALDIFTTLNTVVEALLLHPCSASSSPPVLPVLKSRVRIHHDHGWDHIFYLTQG